MERSKGGGEDEVGGRGAGGKLTKRSFRRPPSTPYDRPPARVREKGWLSKLLVEPASRILPSLFSSPSSHHQQVESATRAPEIDQEDYDGGSKLVSDLQNNCSLPKETGTSAVTGLPNVVSARCVHVGDNHGNASAGNKLAELEHWLKGKIFSSDESNRILELLQSRIVGPPGDGLHAIAAEAKDGALCQKDASCLEKNKHVQPEWKMTLKPSDPHLAAHKEVGSSPIEIAKAYMQGLTSPSEHDSHIARLHDVSASNSSFSSFVKPSICWPGAVVQDDQGYSTPQAQRARFGLFDGPQTPYPGAFSSKATPKFHSVSRRSSNLKSSVMKQPFTPIFGSNKVAKQRSSAVDDGHASTGHARPVHQKGMGTIASIAAVSSDPPSSFSLLSGSTVALNSSSTFRAKRTCRSGKHSFFQPDDAGPQLPKSTVGLSTVHPQSSEMACKILEHLNRSVPSPKDKSLELKMALTRTKISPDSVPMMDDMDYGRPVTRALDIHIVGCLIGTDAQEVANAQKGSTGPSSSKQVHGKDHLSCDHKRRDQGKMEPLCEAADIEMSCKAKSFSRSSSHTSDRTSGCPSKASMGLRCFPDKSASFTFPIPMDMSACSEPPPTPTLGSSLAARAMAVNDEETIPSFKFGQTDAGTSIVFSFGSIPGSNFPGTNLPKFTFGSDKQRSLTFRSIVEDTICY